MNKLPLVLILAAVIRADPVSSAPVPSPTSATVETSSQSTPTPGPLAPAILPGDGLAQHDFFYAGEGHAEDMYIVRKGTIAWSYHVPNGKPEISDAVLLSNGNVLFAHMGGVTEITPDKQVVWNHDAPPGCQIHTAQPIGRDRVLFIQNGPSPTTYVVNIVTGKTELQLPLQVKYPANVHGQFRHARLTTVGTLLVAHMDMKEVREYDEKGDVIWSWTMDSSLGTPWSAIRLNNGNTLVCNSGNGVFEVNPKGEIVWQFTQADAPGYRISGSQVATRLPNGDTLFNNWFNQWNSSLDPKNLPVQAIEVTPDKKIVWALRSWTPPAALGPATTIQILDDPTIIPENVHFGDIR